ICGLALTQISNLPVCPACLDEMKPLDGPLCSVCGEKLFGQRFDADAAPLCGLCRRAAPLFHKAVAYGSYDGPLRDLVHVLKYERVKSAASFLGRVLSEAIANADLPDQLLAVPVPLWKGKRRVGGLYLGEGGCREVLRPLSR